MSSRECAVLSGSSLIAYTIRAIFSCYVQYIVVAYLRVFMVYRNAGYGTLLILNKSAFQFLD